MALGLPILLVGLISYYLPQTDKSLIGDNANFAPMGGGLMGVGLCFTLVGVIRFAYFQGKEKKKVSFPFGTG